jgi:gas vesicle protein
MNTTSKVLIAALGGVALGAVLGILFAPDKGSETRSKMADAAKKFGEEAKETIKEKMKMASGFKTNMKEKAEDFAS